MTLQPGKSAVKLGPMELLLPLAIKGGPPVHFTLRADVQVCMCGHMCMCVLLCVLCVCVRVRVRVHAGSSDGY